ncbi:hypothetical protein C7S17_5511 [Burkholderia thailandensis]|nr:hypothetical protein [Burkholderia thailandensis]
MTSGRARVSELKHFPSPDVCAEVAWHGCIHGCPAQGKSRQNFSSLARRAFAGSRGARRRTRVYQNRNLLRRAMPVALQR